MKKFINKNLKTLIGIAVGAVSGFLYWKFIGCYTGSCAITSNPINSTIYGSVLGALVLSMFEKKKKTEQKETVK